MKSKILVLCAVGMILSSWAAAQDSALSAAPGTPPPPQGWQPAPPDNAGIHLPAKKKINKHKLHMAPVDKNAAPATPPSKP